MTRCDFKDSPWNGVLLVIGGFLNARQEESWKEV
jgi:hypothetical protein